jgi:hypothetical protein
VIFAEHAEHGASAAPIARFALETFFAKEDGLPLPEWPKAIPTAVGAPLPPEEPRNPGPEPANGRGRGESATTPGAVTGRGGNRR